MDKETSTQIVLGLFGTLEFLAFVLVVLLAGIGISVALLVAVWLWG